MIQNIILIFFLPSIGRGHVLAVMSGKAGKNIGSIEHIPGEISDGVHARRKREKSVAGNSSPGRLESDKSTMGCRLSYGVSCIGA